MTRHTAPPGRIVLLNGVSSSGKSTLARQLLRDLHTPWFHLGVDMIGAMRATERTGELGSDEVPAVLARTRAGFHRAVAGMAEAGNDVVADHVLSEPWRLADCLAVFAPFDVLFVGVHCAPDELARRERDRGDRTVGAAAAQLAAVHAHGVYDIEVDTGAEPPAACAARITAVLDRPPSTRAFDVLRRAR